MSRERREGDVRAEGDVARPKRVPMHEQRNRLSVPTKKGWIRRWLIDRGDRLLRAKDAGYRLVNRSEVPAVGDEQIRNTAIGPSSATLTPASGANSDVLVLMEIQEELYNQDQAAKQLEVDKAEQDLLRQLNRGSAHNPTDAPDGVGLMYGRAGPTGARIADPGDRKVFGKRGR
jgi:hypothetical protein